MSNKAEIRGNGVGTRVNLFVALLFYTALTMQLQPISADNHRLEDRRYNMTVVGAPACFDQLTAESVFLNYDNISDWDWTKLVESGQCADLAGEAISPVCAKYTVVSVKVSCVDIYPDYPCYHGLYIYAEPDGVSVVMGPDASENLPGCEQ